MGIEQVVLLLFLLLLPVLQHAAGRMERKQEQAALREHDRGERKASTQGRVAGELERMRERADAESRRAVALRAEAARLREVRERSTSAAESRASRLTLPAPEARRVAAASPAPAPVVAEVPQEAPGSRRDKAARARARQGIVWMEILRPCRGVDPSFRG